jgi:hypothetical protein
MENATRSAGLQPPEAITEAPPVPPPEPYHAPNPLGRLILPGLTLVVIGGVICGVVLPFGQRCARVYEFFRSEVRPPIHPGVRVPQTPFDPTPYNPQQVMPPPIPPIQPPPPAPQPYR